MFILHGELARIPPPLTPVVRDDASEDESEQPAKPKPPPQKPDSFGQLVAVSSPFSGVVFEEHDHRNITNKLLRAGFSEEQVANLPTDTCSTNGCTLSDYSSSRYLLVRRPSGDPETQRRQAITTLRSLAGDDHELAHELQRLAEQSDLETHEIMKVIITLSFSTSNPKGCLSALGNLLGSLKTASAIGFASSSIGDVAAFAARWALKRAKDHPEEARDLASVLSAINLVHNNSDCSDGSASPVHTHEGGEHIETPGHEHSPGITTPTHSHTAEGSEHVLVFDKENGEYVDKFVLNPYYEDSCEDHCYSVDQAVDEVSNAALTASGIEHKADEIYAEAQAERDKVADAQVQVGKVRSRITNASYADNKRELRELTDEERALNRTIGLA